MSLASSQGRPPPTSSEVNDQSSDHLEDDHDDVLSTGSQGSSQSTDDLAVKDMHALYRMMPMVMVKKLEAQQKAAAAAAAARASAAAARDSEEHDGPLRPGETRKRMRKSISTHSIPIVGDSEESDVDIAGSREASPVRPGPEFPILVVYSSDEEGSIHSAIEPIAHQPRPKFRHRSNSATSTSKSQDDAISLSDERDDSEDSDGDGFVRTRRDTRYDGEAKEDNVVDRMLSRTDASVRHRKSKRRRKRGQTGRGGSGGGMSGSHGRRKETQGGSRKRNRQDGLHIKTAGVKRYGSGRQTLLPFERLDSPEAAEMEQDFGMHMSGIHLYCRPH